MAVSSLGALFLVLLIPNEFKPLLKQYATKKSGSAIFGGAFLLSLTLFGITVPPQDSSEQKTEMPERNQVEVQSPETTITEVSPAQNPEKAPPLEFFDVVSVTDGDTLKVNINGQIETLRLIGIDTPETVDPRTPVQCFGKEASDKAKKTLDGKKVRVEADDSQGERDKYNRLLRYLYLEDGTFFNKMMIEDGYAHEYTYGAPYKHQEDFKAAQAIARENKRGLWGDVCNGDTAQPAARPEPKPMPVPPNSSSTSPQTAPSGGAGWACNCKKTCPNMSCAEAQYQLNSCGCSARDADDDGTACDAQCGG